MAQQQIVKIPKHSYEETRRLSNDELFGLVGQCSEQIKAIDIKFERLAARANYLLNRDEKKSRSKAARILRERDSLTQKRKDLVDRCEGIYYEADVRTMKLSDWWIRNTKQ